MIPFTENVMVGLPDVSVEAMVSAVMFVQAFCLGILAMLDLFGRRRHRHAV